MTPMEEATAKVRQAGAEAKELSAKYLVVQRELDTLKEKLAALESNVTSAEQAHATADAAQWLGEAGDLEATQIALDAARKALADTAPDLRHKIRVSNLLVEKFGVMVHEAVAKQQEALAALHAEQNEMLREQLCEEVEKANRLGEEWVAAQDKSIATRELLEERWQRGGVVVGWKEEEMKAVYCKAQPHQSPEARTAHKQSLRAELAAAARV